MNIVFIVNGYYPNYTTNGICINKIIPFINENHTIHVISIKSSEDENDDIMKGREYNHKVITKEFYFRNKFNNKLINNDRVIFNSFNLMLVKLKRYMEAYIGAENISKSLVDAYYIKLKEIRNVDIIIPTCFPFEALEAAKIYHRENEGSVVLPLLFDKFTTSVSHHRSKMNQKIKFKRHLSRERLIFKDSDKIIATYDWKNYMEKYHAKLAEKIQYIEVPALFKNDSDNELINFDFIYTGVLDRKIRPPQKALAIIEEVITKKNDLQFHFVIKGNCSNIINKFSSKFPRNIINHGTLSFRKSSEKMNKSKVLLSIGNTDISQTPSKIFEYMSLNKPIIHFFQDENDRVINILSKYPKSLCINLYGDKINEAKKIIEFYDKDFSQLNMEFSHLVEMFPESYPQYTANIINQTIKGENKYV